MTSPHAATAVLEDGAPPVPAERRTVPAATGLDVGRALDVCIALVVLAALAPFMAMIALVVFVSDPRGKVVFAHRRIGRDGREFDCLKFRTMVVDSAARLAEHLAADPAARAEWNRNHKLRDDPRVTTLGRFLRKSSFDELPQILNVLRGEMAMVGPRPIVRDEIERYGRYFGHYCAQRPGITGLWQISGRSDVDYRRRVAIDVAYCRSRTTMLDMRILVMTIPAVMLSKGSC